MIKLAVFWPLVTKVFEFIAPAIPSSGVYFFTTDSEMRYEVRFGRKQNDVLSVNIVFGVLNEEFGGEEYVLTNKGEVFSVMATIEAIIHHFYDNNPNIRSFEFAGEPANAEQRAEGPTKRTKVYLRYAKRIFPEDMWKIRLEGNKVFIRRKK